MLKGTKSFHKLVKLALAEDLEPAGDLTTHAIIPPDKFSRLVIQARQSGGMMSGSEFAAGVYDVLGAEVQIDFHKRDGELFYPLEKLATLEGPSRRLLEGERLFLNLLQRAISIATYTAQFVEMVKGCKAKILDTRKTTPGLRLLERAAVRDGGGRNHRFNLSSGILIKDNHIAIAGSLEKAIQQAKQFAPQLIKIEVEVDTIDQLKQALDLGVDAVLLDNFSVENLRQAVDLVQGRAITEASGGVTLNSVRLVAECGVDFISIGSLTQSPPPVDIGMDYGI